MSTNLVNLDRIGGKKQSGADVVDVANEALRVNVVAGSTGDGGGLTDAELRATPVPVSGTVTASGPLTNAQLRASAIAVDGSGVTQPISGTVTAQDGGGSLTVDGSVSVSNFPATQPVSATALPLPSGAATSAKQDTGNTSLSSIDGKITAVNTGAVAFASPQHVILDSGTTAVTQATGTNLHVVVDSAPTTAVTGTFWQTTQPVSIATAPVLVAGSAIIGKVGIDQTTPGTTNLVQVGGSLPAGTAVIGHVIVDTAPTTAVTGPLTDTQLRNSAVPVSLASAPSTPVTNANLDVALSTLATASAQTTGNTSLGTIKTNTDPLVTAAAGGYVRQDSTGTIAKESGGNLAAVATSLAPLARTTVETLASIGSLVGQGPLMMATVDSATPSVTDDTIQTLSLTTAQELRVSATSTTLATAARQDTGNASLASLAAEDFATQATLSELTPAQGDSATGVLGPLIQALVSDGLQSYISGVVQPLSMTSDGRLRVSNHPSDIDSAWGGFFTADPYALENPWQGVYSYV